ncbi:hypothetical protein AB0C88_27615 [Streptomyces chartreusis]|uniref:hypothetical protein n=1 Tax=Streptomyces chartreusis TaxID=1969 RepID=UPI0033FDDC9B
MGIELTVAAISAAVALISAIFSSMATRRQSILSEELARQSTKIAREAERHDVLSRFRDPLLWAAFDLQSRLYNIVAQHFLRRCRNFKVAREWEYVKTSTLFVFCDYLGWVEILRRRIQFLDLGSREDNRELIRLLWEIARVFNTGYGDRRYRVWRSEQRAIGEIMIDSRGDADSCLGYVEFCRHIETNPEFIKWTKVLSGDIEAMAGHRRLIALQSSLIDLINFLDPDAERIPANQRSRLAARVDEIP